MKDAVWWRVEIRRSHVVVLDDKGEEWLMNFPTGWSEP